MHIDDDCRAMGEAPKPPLAPGKAQFNAATQCAGVAVLCILMGVATFRLGNSFAYALDGLMTSASYWRLVLGAACLGWFVAAFAFWALSAFWQRAGERIAGVKP